MLKATTFASCLHGVWRVSGSLLGVCECLANAMAQSSPNNNGTFCLQYFPKSFIPGFFARVEGLSGGVWKCLEGIFGVCS